MIDHKIYASNRRQRFDCVRYSVPLGASDASAILNTVTSEARHHRLSLSSPIDRRSPPALEYLGGAEQLSKLAGPPGKGGFHTRLER